MDKIREIPLQYTRRIPLVEKLCPTCNSTFEGPKVRIYCSDECRRKADWAQNGKARNARRKDRKDEAK